MSESKRKFFTGAQKAKVALEVVKGTKTVNEIAQSRYDSHLPNYPLTAHFFTNSRLLCFPV